MGAGSTNVTSQVSGALLNVFMHEHSPTSTARAVANLLACFVAAAFFEDVIATTRDRESSMVRECSWLGAVSTHTNDYGRTSQIRASLDALLTAYPELCIALNHFDAGGEAPDTRSAGQRRQHGRLQVTWVPGMKGLFWKRVLTPERTRGMRMVWLFDADVAVHPSVMPLGLLASALLSSNASALQPLVRAAGMGTDHKWLRQRPSLSSCAASTAKFVEVMTPFLQSDTWEHFHRHVLSHIPDDALARSDFGIDVTWCAAFAGAFPLRPPCLVLFGVAAVHTNSNSIKRFMNATTAKEERMCGATCRYLRRHFSSYWMNYTHDTHDCWSAGHDGLRPSKRPRYVDSHGFWKAGSRKANGTVLTATGQVVVSE